MKIEEHSMKDGSKQIRCFEKAMGTEFELVRFSQEQIRELILWTKLHKPEIIFSIVCEDCPEHMQSMEHQAHCLRQAEEGGRCRGLH